MNNYDLIIIGAGVSGVFAAINSLEKMKVLLIDSNKDILEKFMVTGNGKSNITNTLPTREFLNNIIDSNKFLYPSLNKFNSTNIISFLNDIKINYCEKTRNRIHLLDDNKIFREKVRSILNKKKNIDIALNTKVCFIQKSNNLFLVKTIDNKIYHSKYLIIATGGLSYKNFGCDGSGYELLHTIGHKIEKQYPIGVGFITKNNFKELQGISLDNINISIFNDEKMVYSESGSLMFTHFGVGGPVIRRVSGYASKLLAQNRKPKIYVKWLDDNYVVQQLKENKRLNECFKKMNKNVRNFLLSEFDIKLDLHNIKKEQKNKIIHILTNYELDIISTQSIEFAINTGGGVSIKEINPNTFESCINENLYIIGEILDINPRTNGFNITVCYSTALSAIFDINKKYNE